MVHEIRYYVTYKCNGLQNQIRPDRQSTLCRGTRSWATTSKLDHGTIPWSTIININHMHLWQLLPLRAEHLSSLVGERLEIPPLCQWDSLLGKPCLSSPGVNVPMKIEQGLICSSLPGDMAVEVGRSTAKVPSGLDPLHQSSACAKLCHKELLISWKSYKNIYSPTSLKPKHEIFNFFFY